MPSYLEFECDVSDDGTLPEKWQRAIEANVRQRAGSRVHIIVTGPQRSILANRYYRGPAVCGAILAKYGEQNELMTSDGLHEYNKALWLPYVSRLVAADTGEPMPYVREIVRPDGVIKVQLTTTRLDSTAFSYFVDAVKRDERWAAMGVEFPDEEAAPMPKGMRSFDLEEGEPPMWDPHEVPDYTRAVVLSEIDI